MNFQLVWPNGWVFVYELSGSGFESSCSHLNFRFCVCFEQGVSWLSVNFRVWIHSETRTWRDKNIHSFTVLFFFFMDQHPLLYGQFLMLFYQTKTKLSHSILLLMYLSSTYTIRTCELIIVELIDWVNSAITLFFSFISTQILFLWCASLGFIVSLWS